MKKTLFAILVLGIGSIILFFSLYSFARISDNWNGFKDGEFWIVSKYDNPEKGEFFRYSYDSEDRVALISDITSRDRYIIIFRDGNELITRDVDRETLVGKFLFKFYQM